jgi:hypothetical protein
VTHHQMIKLGYDGRDGKIAVRSASLGRFVIVDIRSNESSISTSIVVDSTSAIDLAEQLLQAVRSLHAA